MKYIILYLLFSSSLFAKTIYVTNNKFEADLIVFESNRSNADLIIYKSTNIYEYGGELLIWNYTKFKYHADLIIYFTKQYTSEVDYKIYFTKYKNNIKIIHSKEE